MRHTLDLALPVLDAEGRSPSRHKVASPEEVEAWVDRFIDLSAQLRGGDLLDRPISPATPGQQSWLAQGAHAHFHGKAGDVPDRLRQRYYTEETKREWRFYLDAQVSMTPIFQDRRKAGPQLPAPTQMRSAT